MKDAIEIGAEGTAELIVSPEDTAIALGSGDVPVLGTPRLLALVEEATCEAVRGAVTADRTTVGSTVELSHRRPTPVGARVTAHARVVARDGAQVVFEVHADHVTAAGERAEMIARGRITRVIVDRGVFLG